MNSLLNLNLDKLNLDRLNLDRLNLDKNVSRTERIISAVAGSLLMIHGIKSGRKISELPLGSFLLFRGATGYCPVKQSVAKSGLSSVIGEKLAGLNGKHSNGREAARPQDIDIITSVTVNRPRQEVYA